MANTFTLKSSSYDGRYMELVCTQTPSDSNNNYSTINWTLTTKGGSVNYYSTGPTKVIINGQTVYSLSRVAWDSYKFPAKKGSVSGTLTVAHENDGYKSINVSFSTAIKEATVGTYSGTWTLDAIPRYATITQSVKYKDEENITIDWVSDSVIDYLWYSIDDGNTWVGASVGDATSGTYTISDCQSGTWHYVITRVRSKESQLLTDSDMLRVVTYEYPCCISTPNFIIGESVILEFYNPLYRDFTFEIIANGVTLTDKLACGDIEYTGVSSKSEQAQLYATIPNQQSGKYAVRVTYNDVSITTDEEGTYSVNPAVCTPVFNDFAYKDYTLSAVTGNDQVLIRKASGLNVTIPSDNKMVTLNGATPQYYVVSIDNESWKVNFSHNDIVLNLPNIQTAGIKRLNVRAYDSRGLSTLVYKDVTVIDYEYPVVNVELTRLNNFEEQTTLKISGTYSRLAIDGEDKNTIQNGWYDYRETGGEWNGQQPITFTAGAGVYTCDDIILMLDRDKSYEFDIFVYDLIDEGDITKTVGIGRAVFMISSNKKTCYINGVEIPTFENVYPIGSVYCNSTNTNPSEIYGGEWTLIDKTFCSSTEELATQLDDTEYITHFYLWSMRSGHSIRFHGWFEAVQDNYFEAIIYVLNLQEHGITPNAFNSGVQFVATVGDQCETMKAFNLYSDGELEARCILNAGDTVHFDFTLPVCYDGMLDEFCDKFYWQRIA